MRISRSHARHDHKPDDRGATGHAGQATSRKVGQSHRNLALIDHARPVCGGMLARHTSCGAVTEPTFGPESTMPRREATARGVHEMLAGADRGGNSASRLRQSRRRRQPTIRTTTDGASELASKQLTCPGANSR